MTLLQVENLSKTFTLKATAGKQARTLMAVDALNLTINRGETVALVGESGCGKSTTGKLVLRLMEPDSGSIKVKGREVANLSQSQLRPLRREMQMIFQDPFSALNPRISIGDSLLEPFVIHRIDSRKENKERVYDLLEKVGLPANVFDRYPHEFSGGQRQRVGIARAIALNPELIVADEAVSALDISIQAQIINLMQDIQEEFNLSYLFISHNLAVVEHISTRVAIMYLGRIVETGMTEEIFSSPRHPYTEALLASIPSLDTPKGSVLSTIPGDPPSPVNIPSGCPFHPRCSYAQSRCKDETPIELTDGSRTVRCHFSL